MFDGPKLCLDRGDDLQRLGHAAGARLAALRHLARVRADGDDAVGDELPEIALRRRMRPHRGFMAGASRIALSVASSTAVARSSAWPFAIFRHQVGGRGRDDDEIAVACEADMADVELGCRIEQIGVGAFARERADRHGRDELLCGAGHHDAHRKAALAQPADQVERLVGGDAARDDEKDLSRCRLGAGRLAGAGTLGFAPASASAAPSASSRRTSSSIERPFAAARSRSRFFTSSPMLRTVRLPIRAV